MSFRAWAKENQPAFGTIASVLAIGTFALAGIRFFLAPPVLGISVQSSELQMPWYLYQSMDRALAADSAHLSDSSGLALRRVRGFLRDTKNFTRITLTNTSSKSLSNVDLRLKYVRDVDGWSLEGDAFDLEERRKLLGNIKYDDNDAIVALKSIARFPPKSSLTLFIWGDIPYNAALGDDQLAVTYDGGAGQIVAERTIKGFDAFVYDNAGLLILLALLLNLGIWNFVLQHRANASLIAPQTNVDGASAKD